MTADVNDPAAAWSTFVDGLRAVGEQLDAQTADLTAVERADGFQALLRALSNQLGRFEIDRDRPELVPFNGWRQKMLMDNPDFRYWVADIRDDRSYRISGTMGDATYLSITAYISEGQLSAEACGRIDSDELHLDEHGRFDVTVSRERPASGDWLPLADGASMVWVRQFHDDVANDRSGTAVIEPLDDVPAVRLDPDDFATRLRQLGQGFGLFPRIFASATEEDLARPNEFRHWTEMAAGAAFTEPNVRYVRGAWKLADDEALIVEGEPVACRYWNVLLYNRFLNSLDYRARPVTRTGATAQLVDGRYRLVLAARDPGVAGDWLDTEGRDFGLVVFRFLQPESEPTLPTVRRVKLADLEAGEPLEATAAVDAVAPANGAAPSASPRLTSGWTPAPKSPVAALAHEAAETDRTANPSRFELDAENCVALAVEQGVDVSALPPGWREGLEQYVGSAREDARLNALGAGMILTSAVGRLRAGAEMTRFRAETNAPARGDLLGPIVIVGGWRTGTTFLFRLLATDPQLRGPLPAELSDPVAVATMNDAEREEFIDASAAMSDTLYALNPELRAIHDSGPRMAEECVLGMGTDLRNWGFLATARLESYWKWLSTQDLSGSYERYRHILEALDRGDGRRWVLKAPAHTAELQHLVQTFPGATVVHLHRDIVETVASGASLFATFRSSFSDEVDAADVGRFQAEQTELWMRRAVAYRADPRSAAATFLDLGYDELITDTPAALARVYNAAGIEPPSDLVGMIDAFHATQPRHAHGQHKYSAEDFGLVADELRERFAFLEEISRVPERRA